MKKTSIPKELLISVIREELPQLSQEQQHKIAEILSDYVLLLHEGQIEEADRFVQENYKHLVKII